MAKKDFKKLMEQVKKNYNFEDLEEKEKEVEEVLEEAEGVEEEIEVDRGRELAAPTYIRAHFNSETKGDTALIAIYQNIASLETELVAAKEEINVAMQKLESVTKEMMVKESAINANEKIALAREEVLRKDIEELKAVKDELQKILA